MARRAGCTPEIAYKVWQEAGKPSMRALKDILAEKGYSVHNDTLGNWKDRIPAWQAEWAAKMAPVRPEHIIKSLEAAALAAPHLKTDHFMGIKAQLVARLFDTIQVLPVATVDDLRLALDCCERIEGLIHAERGKTVADTAGARPSVGLASRLNGGNGAVITGPFKKPVATAGGGNGANGAGEH